MRTPITLKEFLFTLNQDEDIRVHLIDYEKDERLYSGWKSSFLFDNSKSVLKYWFVQDFTLSEGGLEITIVEFEKELD